MSLRSLIEHDLRMLRQSVVNAREAKERGWTLDGLNEDYRKTSPGDLYEFLMFSAIPFLLDELDKNIQLLQENGDDETPA